MQANNPLVSIGLPVHNGQETIENVVKSVLAQDHENIELIISDNASEDGTEEICRELARADVRVAYHRRPENVGLLRNFTGTVQLARGTYFRWIGDDDWIHPGYVSRCLEVFAEDTRLVLVSTQLGYMLSDGSVESAVYDGIALRSDDPADRFAEMLRLLTEGYAVLDPLYGLIRRETLAALPRRSTLREDEVFAARLALAGPWGHIPQVLARRSWSYQPLPRIARRLGIPRWESRMAIGIECRELLRLVSASALTPDQARRARAEVARHGLRRTTRAAERSGRKLARVAGARWAGATPGSGARRSFGTSGN